MKLIDPPVTNWRRDRSADDPDGLLRAFFRAEMPRHWPPFHRPDRPARETASRNSRTDTERALGRPNNPRRNWAMARSRLALAATVALLLVGTLFLTGPFDSGSGRRGQDDSRPGVFSRRRGIEMAPGYGRSIKDIIIKESLIQEVDTKPGPDGQPIRQDQPTKYLIEIYER